MRAYASTVRSQAAPPAARASNVFASLRPGQSNAVCPCGAAASTGVLPAATEPGIQRVAERVAQEVEREHRDEDRDPRTRAHPPLHVREVALRVVDVLSPRGVRGLRPEAEERKRRFREDRE